MLITDIQRQWALSEFRQQKTATILNKLTKYEGGRKVAKLDKYEQNGKKGCRKSQFANRTFANRNIK
jgi:hypothetical protein